MKKGILFLIPVHHKAFSRVVAALLCTLLVVGGLGTSVQASVKNEKAEINALARDIERVESIRAVKNLQRTYSQYSQYGLWNEMAGLFTEDASFIVTAPGTGPVESVDIQGRDTIADWLTTIGGGQQGLATGALNAHLIDEPLVNLSVDGQTAKARWMNFSWLGDGQGNATIAGGIYENEYALEGGVWKISVSHYYPYFTGPYEVGFTNVNSANLPLVPYHFTLDETGIPIPPAEGDAPHSPQSIKQLEERVDRLNDEDEVRNLQHAYGYYVHRKMWDDVVDLFADDSAIELKGEGTFYGRASVKQVMEQFMGPSTEAGAAGLKHGELNDRLLWDTLVEVVSDNEAYTRGVEVGMLGEADKEEGSWTISVYRNRFVKEDGIWKLKEVRYYPMMKADYYEGWGNEGVLEQATTTVPEFLTVNPGTQKKVNTLGLEVLGKKNLTGNIKSNSGNDNSRLSDTERLAEVQRKLSKSAAWDATENVNAAYCYYLDDMQWAKMAGVFAEKGNKQSPFAGYYLGKERIEMAATIRYGAGSTAPRGGIALHYVVQPVILVSEDGRSTSSRTYLFEPMTRKTPGIINSGMYPNNQTILENGIWRMWTLEIDEFYMEMAGWANGWAKAKDKVTPTPPSPLLTLYPPDILLSDLGVRQEHFRAGVGEQYEWPKIVPMWFNYRNPVTGHVPDLYWPGSVIKVIAPNTTLEANGYQEPPTGPGPEPDL